MIKSTASDKYSDNPNPPANQSTPVKIPQPSIYNKSTHKKRRTQSITHPSQLLDLLFKQLDNLVQITTQQHPLYIQFQKQNTLLHYQNRSLEYECQVLQESISNNQLLMQEQSQMERLLNEKNQEVKNKLQILLNDIVRKESDMMMYLENIIQFLQQ